MLVMSEGSFGDKPVAFFDLFRVANGKIASIWITANPQQGWVRMRQRSPAVP